MKVPKFVIYTLIDPVSMEIRYVGKSSSGKYRATTKHTHGRCGNWVASLDKLNKKPIVKYLQGWETIDKKELCNAEIYWIAYFRALGCPLTNLTDGGEGWAGAKHTEEFKKNLAERNRNRIITDETKQKISNSLIGNKMSADARAKMSKSRIGNKHRLGKPHTPETLAKMSFSARNPSEETRQKMSKSQKGKKHTEETKAKISAANLRRARRNAP